MLILFDTNLDCVCIVCRGNLDKRLTNLKRQIQERKVIKPGKVFVRPKKRVMNKLHPSRRKKKKKKRRRRQHSPRGDILDSQTSISLLLDSQTQLSRRKKTKNKRRRRQHSPRGGILDRRASLSLLLDSQTQLSQHYHKSSQQLSITPSPSTPSTPSQEYNPESQLCLSLSVPVCSSPIMSLEMSPLTQTSPPHPATDWEKMDSVP